MKKLVKREFKDTGDAIYEFSHFVDHVEKDGYTEVKPSFRIMKTHLKNDVGVITEETKSIIDSIKNR